MKPSDWILDWLEATLEWLGTGGGLLAGALFVLITGMALGSYASRAHDPTTGFVVSLLAGILSGMMFHTAISELIGERRERKWQEAQEAGREERERKRREWVASMIRIHAKEAKWRRSALELERPSAPEGQP